MIKKSLILLVLLFNLLSLNLIAQCTPDVSCLPAGSTSGICPSSELDTGTVTIPYSEVVSMKIPADGSDFGQPLTTILHVDIVSVDSLAPGLSYTCNPPGCVFPGNSTGCILVQGIPTTAWDHTMTVHAKAYVRILFINSTQPQTLTGFHSVVLHPAGIESIADLKFEVEQNSPNPFNEETTINFFSPDDGEAKFRVMDLLGNVIYFESLKPDRGLNAIRLSANLFSTGVYIFSIQSDAGTISRRMIVAD